MLSSRRFKSRSRKKGYDIQDLLGCAGERAGFEPTILWSSRRRIALSITHRSRAFCRRAFVNARQKRSHTPGPVQHLGRPGLFRSTAFARWRDRFGSPLSIPAQGAELVERSQLLELICKLAQISSTRRPPLHFRATAHPPHCSTGNVDPVLFRLVVEVGSQSRFAPDALWL